MRSELLSATGQWHAGRLQRWWDLHGTLAQQPRVLNLLPGTVANKIVNWNFNIMLLNSSYRNCAAVVVAVAVSILVIWLMLINNSEPVVPPGAVRLNLMYFAIFVSV